jgi:hypothetical protein
LREKRGAQAVCAEPNNDEWQLSLNRLLQFQIHRAWRYDNATISDGFVRPI